ncbi:hypothetical protein ACTFIY_002183 [Dictyostelium cf. discoideum]
MSKVGCDFLSFEADSYVEELLKKEFFLSKNTKKLVQSLEINGYVKPEVEEKKNDNQRNIDENGDFFYDNDLYNKSNKNKYNNIDNNNNKNDKYHQNNSIINNFGFNNGYISNGGLNWGNINSKNNNNNNNNNINNSMLPKFANKRWSNLSIRIIYPKDCMLARGVERLFSFDVKTDYFMFYHKLDDRRPDFTQIFLNKFKIYDLINENPFSVVLTFFGLPKSYSSNGDISFNILINGNTTHKLLNQQHLSKTRPSQTFLVSGSKKKRIGEEDPIPLPEFDDIHLDSDSDSIYPVYLFAKENPQIYGKCRDLDGGHRSCDKDSKCIKNRYNLFNLYEFGVEVKKLDGGAFPKQGNGEISFKIDMTYYFMHFFSKE